MEMDKPLLLMDESIRLPDTSVIADMPPRRLIIEGPAGKKAVLDFSGDAVTYSGDLPVEESARLFFDAVFRLYIPVR